MNQEWDIKARGESCAKCDRPFDDGQSFVSRLAFGPEGYERRDLCESCVDEDATHNGGGGGAGICTLRIR